MIPEGLSHVYFRYPLLRGKWHENLDTRESWVEFYAAMLSLSLLVQTDENSFKTSDVFL